MLHPTPMLLVVHMAEQVLPAQAHDLADKQRKQEETQLRDDEAKQAAMTIATAAAGILSSPAAAAAASNGQLRPAQQTYQPSRHAAAVVASVVSCASRAACGACS